MYFDKREESLKANFSKNESWSQAFGKLVQALQTHYPFTQHRGIDWQALSAAYLPVVEQAEQAQDRAQYILALKEMMVQLRDGHCSVEPRGKRMCSAWEDCERQALDGGFGVVFARLDSGQVAVVYVFDEIGDLGVCLGDIVLEVDGKPVHEAVQAVSLRWADPVPATTAHIDSERLRFLSRAPAGTQLYLKMQREATEFEISLEAVREDRHSCEMQKLFYLPDDYEEKKPSRWLQHHVDGNIGVLTVPHFDNGEAVLFKKVERALEDFRQAAVQAIVLDLRGNDGGDDDEPPILLGFFTDKRLLIENVALPCASVSLMQQAGETFTECAREGFMLGPASDKPSYAEPHTESLRWLGTTVVLVNRRTLSNGDMTAFGARSCGAHIIGFEGTSGSVSLSDGEITLPELDVSFTMGQSCDVNGNIQIEAGADGVGGISPDTTIPRTVPNLHAWSRWQLKRLSGGDLQPDAEDVEMGCARRWIAGCDKSIRWETPAAEPVSAEAAVAEAAAEALLAELESMELAPTKRKAKAKAPSKAKKKKKK